ncbi:MAG: hypothetical protein JO029_16050 [Candidatus Eremiobacteraeota bacterium]|nr:hypothetical protein [Candidatus Eremiobacteraeota bacterium]MBV8583223.1 hypothetical protein [Candidatus Eremiobacteraeota bacterium]
MAFYEGAAPDDRGRFLHDIVAFDDAALEYTHDFIQWLFPLRERSGANPDAPVLDDATVAAFASRSELRAALHRSLDRMLAFYGLAWNADRIVVSANFDARRGWLTPGNHNHLRLTRMMVSLRTLGLTVQSVALHRCLTELAQTEGGVTAATLRYWDAAVS